MHLRIGELGVSSGDARFSRCCAVISAVRRPAPKYLLVRDNRVWMSLSPVEVESLALHVAHMRGHVVIAGLGMGLALYNAVLHPAVRQITVSECDSEVVALFARITGPGWPESGRFSIERVDARDWRSPEPVDFLYVDIRDKVGASEAAADTRIICRNLRPKSAGYWGMEADFVLFLARKPLQAAGDASTVSGLGACASVCLSQPRTIALGSRASWMSQPS